MGAKKAEAELGSFDCVHSESGKAPSVGKLSVFKTSLVFKSQTFGLGEATAISVKRKDLDALDATSALTLKIQYKKTKSLDLQFTKSAKPYDLIVAKYRLSATEREGFSVNDRAKRNGDGRSANLCTVYCTLSTVWRHVEYSHSIGSEWSNVVYTHVYYFDETKWICEKDYF